MRRRVALVLEPGMSVAIECWVNALRRDGFVVTRRGGKAGDDWDAQLAEWRQRIVSEQF